MTKWADYCISKLSMDNGLITSVTCFTDNINSIDNESERSRAWMVTQINAGRTFCSIETMENGKWIKKGDFNYNGLFSWSPLLPLNLTRRKTFVSYYHVGDQYYRELFKNLFDDLILCKSVNKDDIDSDNSDEYIKKLIHDDFLADTTVLVVLIGPSTRHRKHIDWEISGALNVKVGDSYSGILGLLLPNHPDFGTTSATYNLMPARLADNFKSGYAIVRDWTTDRRTMQSYIEQAFENRSKTSLIENSRLQMTRNTNE